MNMSGIALKINGLKNWAFTDHFTWKFCNVGGKYKIYVLSCFTLYFEVLLNAYYLDLFTKGFDL